MMEVASSECNDSQQNTRKNMKSKLIQLGAIATAAIVAGSAIPATAGIPTGLFRDSTNSIYLMGQTVGASVELTYEGLTASRDLQANACGLAGLRGTDANPLPTFFTVNGVVVTVASLPTQLKPGCITATGQLEEARTANFKTAAGEVVIIASPNAIVPITYDATKIRKAKVNACGVAKWSTTQSYTNLGTQVVSGGGVTSTQISTLPAPGGFPVCRTGSLLVPIAWATN
jgi:hypothetical protein